MKKSFPYIISGISCILSVICIVQLFNLKSDISDLAGNCKYYYTSGLSQNEDLKSDILDSLQNQSNIFSYSHWNFEKADIKNRTVEAVFSFTPKEFSPDKTTASIILDNKEYPLQYKDGKYTAKLILDLFKNYNSQEVRFTTDGMISSQGLDWQICPAVEFLPSFSLNSGELPYNTVKNSDGKTTLSVSDFGKIVSQNEVQYNLTDCKIITEVDDKELYSDTVDLSEKGQTEYMNALGEQDNDNGFTPVYFKYEHSLSVSQNGSVYIYADMTDENGLIYRCSLLNIKLNDGEAYSEDYFCSSDIYDKNGDLLFSPNEN